MAMADLDALPLEMDIWDSGVSEDMTMGALSEESEMTSLSGAGFFSTLTRRWVFVIVRGLIADVDRG